MFFPSFPCVSLFEFITSMYSQWLKGLGRRILRCISVQLSVIYSCMRLICGHESYRITVKAVLLLECGLMQYVATSCSLDICDFCGVK